MADCPSGVDGKSQNTDKPHQTVDPSQLWSYSCFKLSPFSRPAEKIIKKRHPHIHFRVLSGVAGFIIASLAVHASCFKVADAASIEVPRITVEQTKNLLDNPEVVIIDVRTARTWWSSRTKILNAVREEPGSVNKWAAKYPKDKTLIFY